MIAVGSSRLLRTAALLTVGLTFASGASANALQVDFHGQSPPNIVPTPQSVTYFFRSTNVNDGSSVESDGIAVGFWLYLNGVRVPANSGVFTSNGCQPAPLSPDSWSCVDLDSTGSVQNFSFTWVNSEAGTNFLTLRAFCSEIPVPSTGERVCDVNGLPFASIVATVETIIIMPDPTASLEASDTVVTAGTEITLTWASTDAASCFGSWTGGELAFSGETTVTVNSTTTFWISCSNAVGSDVEQVEVTVVPDRVFADGFEGELESTGQE